MIRIAVIGAGGYAGFLADRLLKTSDRYLIVAIVSFRPEEAPRVEVCTARGARVYSSADEMWQNICPDNCDAVMVPTGINFHFVYTSEALKRGFHVLLEKPPVPTVQELDELIELQKNRQISRRRFPVSLHRLVAKAEAIADERSDGKNQECPRNGGLAAHD